MRNHSMSTSAENDTELRRGPWTLEEDTLLVHYIARHGEGRWNLLAKRSGLKRTGKSCRLRWLNYLKPDVKRGNLTPQEQMSILELHSKWGNRWSKIAQHLPGRTDNEIKNYWRTRVQKQARHLKVDANSTAFQDVIRYFWIPRLLQKIDGSSSSSSSSALCSQSSTANPQPFDHSFQNPTAALPTPPKLMPGQETFNYVSGEVHQFDHHELNSDTNSEHGTNSCVSSAESMNITQISHFSDYQTSPFHVINSSNDQYSTFPKDFYHVNNNCCDMETMADQGDFNNPLRDCQMECSNWVDYDLPDNMWNMDELWQFRNSLESGA